MQLRGAPWRRHAAGLVSRALVLAIVVAAMAACGKKADAESGVEGTVSMGPMCAVAQEGSPCPDAPLKVRLVVQKLSGKDVVEAMSHADGTFRIPLEPGEYVLVPEEASAAGVEPIVPVSFIIEDGAWTTVDVHYDTGLR
jgi:hypothetical protein